MATSSGLGRRMQGLILQDMGLTPLVPSVSPEIASLTVES